MLLLQSGKSGETVNPVMTLPDFHLLLHLSLSLSGTADLGVPYLTLYCCHI